MIKLKALFFTLALLCFASFIWAIRSFFTSPDKMKTGMCVISLSGTLSMALHLGAIMFARVNLSYLTTFGIAAYLGSLGLFWWSIYTVRTKPLSLAFSTDVPAYLVATGPYRFVRHPIYTSYLLCWIAGVIVARQYWLTVTLAMMFSLYYKAAIYEEAKFSGSSLAADYQKYKQTRGMFFPKLPGSFAGQIREHHV